MAARGRRSSPTARLLVLVGIVAVLGGTFLAGVYAGRIWSARAAVVAAHVPDTEPARRGPGRGGRLPEVPAPQLTFYRELTAPLTAPPPPPRPLKTAPPPLATAPAAALRQSLASAGHDARVVAADANGPVYRVQIGEFPSREAARALATRLAGERPVTP